MRVFLAVFCACAAVVAANIGDPDNWATETANTIHRDKGLPCGPVAPEDLPAAKQHYEQFIPFLQAKTDEFIQASATVTSENLKAAMKSVEDHLHEYLAEQKDELNELEVSQSP